MPIAFICQPVLLNLALNGMDAMKDGASRPRIVFQATQIAGAKVEVAVFRHWNRHSRRQAQRDLSEPFVTTKKNGTGLGLSIARTIVEMYGGTIWAENRQYGGAACRFVLPLRSVSRMTCLSLRRFISWTMTRRFARWMSWRLLRGVGYQTALYEFAGTYLLKQLPADETGCILLDLQMSGVQGLELQEHLVRAGNVLAIVFLTGHGDIRAGVRAHEGGS